MPSEQVQAKINTLRRQIADLKKRLPAHSIPPAMMAQLDDLEEQLETLEKAAQDSVGEE